MENKQKNSRKRLNSLILLVAFTAVMLIVSTYAWFSTQKNVTISGLKGNVNVAEGLQISLDAQVWANSIDLTNGFAHDAAYGNPTTSTTYLAESGATFQAPYTYADGTKAYNITPSELLPVSTTGTSGEGIAKTSLQMWRGNITDSVKLDTITLIPDASDTEDVGYYAFDVFLQNTSGSGVTAEDILQLETNSNVTVNSGKEATGLQNTVRVALALYDATNALDPNDTPTGAQIIANTKDTNITDVAIWEPNAYGSYDDDDSDSEADLVAHVPTIVSSMTYLKLKEADATAAGLTYNAAATLINSTAQVPTYALTSASKDAEDITTTLKGLKNTFDWATPSAGLEKQITLQTSVEGVGDEAVPFVSVSKVDADADATDTTFTIPANSYVKMRVYVWLEGQDVDCLNYASLGGGITVDLGFSKPGSGS